MAANAVGNLSVKLQLDAAQFQAALQGAGVSIQQFAQRTTVIQTSTVKASAGVGRFGAAMSGIGPIMQQGAFAAQDFASQLGTRGLGGALQAASNNIQVMGAAFGPQGMIVSAFVGVAVQALGSYIEFQEKAAKKTEDSAKRRIEAEKRVAEQMKAMAEQRDFTSGLRKADAFTIDNADALQNRITDLSGQGRERGAAMREIQRSMFDNLPELNRVFSFDEAIRGNMLNNLQQTIGADAFKAIPEDRRLLIGELGKEFNKLRDEGMIAGRELANLQQLLPERRREEMLASNRDEQKKGDASALEQRNKLREEGDAIRRRFETDGERRLRDFNELSLARSLGQISEAEFLRFGKKALEEDKLSPTGANSKMAGAFDFGSSDAMSAINKALRMNPTERDAKKTAEESAKTTEQLRKANESLRQMDKTLREQGIYTATF